jgi:chemotaxis protein MotA
VDIATIVGIIAAFGLVIVSIMMGSPLTLFIDYPSVLIVFGGTLGATLINYPLKEVLSIVKVTSQAFFQKLPLPSSLIPVLVEAAKKARVEGVLSLESVIKEGNHDPFFVKGLQLAIDGTEPDLINQIMEVEMDYISSRHKIGIGVLDAMGNYAPALGMIGTLIGLVMMLQSMNDPSAIGPAMAVALITTFYGSILANLVFIPIAGKLRLRSEEELLLKEIILAGILSIQSGDNPRIVEQKLNNYVPPKQRVSVYNQ